MHLEVLKNPRAKDEKYAAEVVAFVMPGNRKKTVPVRVKATSHDMSPRAAVGRAQFASKMHFFL